MRNIEYWAMLCEENTDKIISKNDDTDIDNGKETSNQTTDNQSENDVGPNENEKPQIVHFALCANIKNGLFKKDDIVYICQVGSSNNDGIPQSSVTLDEDDGDSLSWDNKDKEFNSYNPNQDNDWDYIEGFAKCGKNADILKRVKDHYGNKLRTFSIVEYYPQDSQDLFSDHIDQSMMNGLVPYKR